MVSKIAVFTTNKLIIFPMVLATSNQIYLKVRQKMHYQLFPKTDKWNKELSWWTTKNKNPNLVPHSNFSFRQIKIKTKDNKHAFLSQDMENSSGTIFTSSRTSLSAVSAGSSPGSKPPPGTTHKFVQRLLDTRRTWNVKNVLYGRWILIIDFGGALGFLQHF